MPTPAIWNTLYAAATSDIFSLLLVMLGIVSAAVVVLFKRR